MFDATAEATTIVARAATPTVRPAASRRFGRKRSYMDLDMSPPVSMRATRSRTRTLRNGSHTALTGISHRRRPLPLCGLDRPVRLVSLLSEQRDEREVQLDLADQLLELAGS